MVDRLLTDQVGNASFLIDGDTEYNQKTGKRERIEGIDTRELSKVNDDGQYEPAQVGALEQRDAIGQLIQDGGFNFKVETDREDQYGRPIIERYNEKGESLSEVAIATGIAEPNAFTDSDLMRAREDAYLQQQLTGKPGQYADLANEVDNVLNAQGLMFKTLAIDESTYNPDIHSGVQFRDHRRTLDNELKGFWPQVGEAWDLGWTGVKEGFYGYLDAIGETTGIEMIEDIGDAGIARARMVTRNAPKILLDYKDVDGVTTAFSYLLNNAAMSAPYMVTTFASLAAAVPATFFAGPVGGLAVANIPNTMIYGGHVWNEMEGDRGVNQFVVASVAGLGMATLDRIGLKGLMTPSKILTNEGVEEAAKMLVARNQIAIKAGASVPALSLTAAKAQILQATKTEQATYLKSLMQLDNAKDTIKKYGQPFSFKDVGKQGVFSAFREAGTEIGQESIQYGAAVGFSDKTYDQEQYFDRIINAGIAGGSLGGGLGMAGQVYTQGKDQIYLSLVAPGDLERYGTFNKKRMVDSNSGKKINSVEENIKEKDFQESQERTAPTSKTIFYDTVGNPVVGEVIAVSSSGQKRIRLENGTEGLIDYDFFETSPYDTKTINDDTLAAIPLEISDMALPRLKMLEKEISDKIKAIRADKTILNKETRITERLRQLQAVQQQIAIRDNKSLKPAEPAVNTITGQVEEEAVTMDSLAKDFEKDSKGVVNFFKNNKDLYDYATAVSSGIMKLVRSLEKTAISANNAIKDMDAMDILARFGQLTTGAYHSGMAFRQFQDKLLSSFKSFIDENGIAIALGYSKGMTSGNVEEISRRIIAFTEAPEGQLSPYELYKIHLAKVNSRNQGDPEVVWSDPVYNEAEARALHAAALQLETSYNTLISAMNEELKNESPGTKPFEVGENFWRTNRGFDWKKVKRNRAKFKAFLTDPDKGDFTEQEAELMWQQIAYRNQATFLADYSVVGGQTYLPNFTNDQMRFLQSFPEFKEFATDNIFETLNTAQVEAAKYITITKYFGHGGRKLDYMFNRMMRRAKSGESGLTEEEVKQFAYYIKAGIDAAYGNFKTLDNPTWAAINRFLVSWSIFAGLPLAMISSLPETAMVYMALKDDEQFKSANRQLINQVSGMFEKAVRDEVKRTEKLLDKIGLPYDQQTIVDRLATGERDVAYLKWHEAYFKITGIKGITQIQRRMNAGLALDVLKGNAYELLSAPKKNVRGFIQFDFDNFNAGELEAYAQMGDLGIDVERFITLLADVEERYRDSFFDPAEAVINEDTHFVEFSDKQKALVAALNKAKEVKLTDSQGNLLLEMSQLQDEINEAVETATYRFVIERIQSPQSTNRPLFFQDPRYQLLTQFNGFISTFTANVIPKLYNNYLRKGNPAIKYNTFAMMVLMLGLGGASQYFKDKIKFGKPSPYLDELGYVQRAIYASGLLGQGERVVDALYPLYPERDDRFLQTLLGETGPAARNIMNVAKGTGKLLSAEDKEDAQQGLQNIFKAAPMIGPATNLRKIGAEAVTGENPFGQGGTGQQYYDDITKNLF